MAQPTPYNKTYNFQALQTSGPGGVFPANLVDIELNNIETTLDEILENIASIQRDDGQLTNRSVGMDQLDADVLAALAANGLTEDEVDDLIERIRDGLAVVTLIQFGGVPDYNDAAHTGTDNLSVLQDALDYLNAQGGGVLRITADNDGRGDYRLGVGQTVNTAGQAEPSISPIIYDNTIVIFDANCYLWRDWKTATADFQSPVFRNEHCPHPSAFNVNPGPYTQASRNSNIEFHGPGGIKVTTYIDALAQSEGDVTGPHISMMFCDRVTIHNMKFSRVFGMQAISIGGNDWVYTDNRHFDPLSNVNQTGLRIYFCDGGLCDGNYFNTGEDCIGIGSGYNFAIKNITIGPNWYFSYYGHMVQIVQVRNGITAAYDPPTEAVENIVITGGWGKVGQDSNAGIRINCATGNPDPTLMRNITIDGFVIDQAGDHNDSNAYGILVQGGKNIRIRGKVLSPRNNAIRITDGTDNIFLDIDVERGAGGHTVYLDGIGEIEIAGRVQAPSSSNDGIYANDVSLLKLRDLTVYDIASGRYGVQLDGTTVCYANNYMPIGASGGSNARGFLFSDTTTKLTHIGSVMDFIGIMRVATSTPSYYRAMNMAKEPLSRTIADPSGAIPYNGEPIVSLLCFGGASDSASSMAGLENERVIIKSGEASPASVVAKIVHGTGANAFDLTKVNGAADYDLDAAGRGIELVYQGGTWRGVAIW